MKAFITLLVVLVLFAVVSNMDYEDAKKSEAHTCQMVKDGAWPKALATNLECNK